MGPSPQSWYLHLVETSHFVSKLIETCRKKGDEISVVASYVRSKISFELVKSQIACIRGSRKRKKMVIDVAEMDIVAQTSTIDE